MYHFGFLLKRLVWALEKASRQRCLYRRISLKECNNFTLPSNLENTFRDLPGKLSFANRKHFDVVILLLGIVQAGKKASEMPLPAPSKNTMPYLPTELFIVIL